MEGGTKKYYIGLFAGGATGDNETKCARLIKCGLGVLNECSGKE